VARSEVDRPDDVPETNEVTVRTVPRRGQAVQLEPIAITGQIQSDILIDPDEGI